MSDHVSTGRISKSPPLPRARTPVERHKNANCRWTNDERKWVIGQRMPDRCMPYRAIGKRLGRSAQACRLVMHHWRTGKTEGWDDEDTQSTPASTPSLGAASSASSSSSAAGPATQSKPYPPLVPLKAASTWTAPGWRPAEDAQPAQSFGGMEMAPQPAPVQSPSTSSAHVGVHYYHQPAHVFVGPHVPHVSPTPGVFYTHGQPFVYNVTPATQQYYPPPAGHAYQAPPSQMSPLTSTQVQSAYGMNAAGPSSTYGQGPVAHRTRSATSSPVVAPVAQGEVNAAYTSPATTFHGDATTAASTSSAAAATMNGDVGPSERPEAETNHAAKRRRQDLHDMWK
ncbi:Hypothetical predicted protein [Lecanosticta acicola]|uniref:Uncharacterized protein n=1 Tax=Lecanosticta acicola TaxID=111012 RepID=A0AAI9ECJ0_9PEZI|nr:Hypothetical predicted protein [Lecanosticta acicola]